MEIDLLSAATTELPLLTEHQSAEFVYAADGATWLELAIDGQLIEPFLRPGQSAWRWRWNPGPAVGVRMLTLTTIAATGERQVHEWQLRVAPRKIDQEHYALLLEDVQHTAYNLVYALGGAGAEGAELRRAAPWQRSRLEEYYALIDGQLDGLARAVRRIAARPREQLRTVPGKVPLGQATTLDSDALAQAARGMFDPAPPEAAAELQQALRSGGGLLPQQIAAPRSTPTFDIYEHRLLKHLLTLLLQRARFIGRLADQEAERAAQSESWTSTGSGRTARARQISSGCVAAAQTLRELRALPFLAEVQPFSGFRGPTPLLQRDAAYREVYHTWQALRQHPFLAFDSPLFNIPISDLPRLYESWCALQVAQALCALGGKIQQQQLIEQRQTDADDELALLVTLPERTPLLTLHLAGATLTLWYQRRYRPVTEDRYLTREGREKCEGREGAQRGEPTTDDGQPVATPRPLGRLHSLDRHVRVPDLALEIGRPGAAPQVLVLDAKYRLDAEGRGVPQDALADAYTYLGAIGAAGERATISALLLYPGTGSVERYPSGVGAVPLLPGRTEPLVIVLRQVLNVVRREA